MWIWWLTMAFGDENIKRAENLGKNRISSLENEFCAL